MQKIKTLLIAFALTFGGLSLSAQDFTWTEEDVWTAYEAFYNNLIDPTKRIYKADTEQPKADHRGNGYRDGDVSGCAAAIWCQAPYFDMAINAAILAEKSEILTNAQKKKYKNAVKNMYKGQKAHYTNFDFDDNNTNNGWFIYDDIMWWTVALAHAYEYDPTFEDYLKYAEESFCRTWYGSEKVGDTGSYSDPTVEGQSGGMYWQWQPIEGPNPNKEGDFKSACINFPTIIAMATLHQIVPEGRTAPTEKYPTYQTKEFYKEKAIEVYAWAKEHLVPNANGRVADGMHGGGPEYSDHLYNQATYIGASCLLYKITGEEEYLANAKRGVTYVKNGMSKRNSDGVRVLPYENGYEQGVYCCIFSEYMDMFINELGQGNHASCKEWLRQNIQLGWNNRDSRNLNNGKFGEKTEDGSVVESYGASGLPSLMLVIPATDVTDGISQVGVTEKKNDNVIYSISGKALMNNADSDDIDSMEKGVYILNGTKYAVK